MSEETLFHEARRCESAKRDAFLEANCADPEMRRRVDVRLKALDAAGSVLEPSELTGEYIPRAVAGEIQSAAVEQPGTIIGSYKLLQILGEGGMGTVWVAEQSQPVQRRVALKLIKAGMDSTHVLRRFEAERQALALMEHPNIAKVLDAGATPQGRPFFAMELIQGIPITKYCDQEHLTPRERLELFIPVCQAVQHAHQKGVIHRDLKPSNVLIALYDGKPVPKVIDFGVAKAISQKLTERTMHTEVGQIIGTLEYMAPEQAELNNLDIDTRADIYSLGVILYELLAGSPPFTSLQLRGAAFTEMLRLIREVEPPKPSTRLSSSDQLPSIAANRMLEPHRLMRSLQGDLDWIVMKALEKDRARRYETANGFAMDVLCYLADEPVLAGPPNAVYRLRKLIRRNRGPVLAAAAVTLTLVTGVAAVVIVQARANANLAHKNVELDGEKAKVEAQNKGLAEEQIKVKARFELAQSAIETFHTGASQDVLLKQEPLKELRNKLLKSAADFYRQLEKLLKDEQDDDSRLALGKSYSKLSNLTYLIGDRTEALAIQLRALTIFQKLADANPVVTQFETELARSHHYIGILQMETGLGKEALESYERSLAIRKKLVDANPDDSQFQSELARSHDKIGILKRQSGKGMEALESYWRALTIRQTLADANPATPEFQSDMAASHGNIGNLQREAGHAKEALESYQRALAIYQTLSDSNPTVAEFQINLATGHNDIGILLSKTGRELEALESYQRALVIRQTVANDNPAVTVFQSDLAANHGNIGNLQSETGQATKALESYLRAQAVYQKLADDNPAVTEFQINLANSHNSIGLLLKETGKASGALASYRCALALQQKLVDDNPDVTRFQIHLAASYNNLGLLQGELGKVEEALESYRRARSLQQILVDTKPGVTQFQRDLAASHNNIGILRRRMGDEKEALESYQRALTLQRKLVDDNPTFTEFQRDLAVSHNNIGNLLSDTGKAKEALESYERTLAIFQRLADANPTVSQFQINLAGSHNNIGILQSEAGKGREAMESYQRALAIQQKLADANPAVSQFQSELAGSHNAVGILQRRSGKAKEALKSYQRALAIQRTLADANPSVAQFQCDLALSHNNIGVLHGEMGKGKEALESSRNALDILRPLADANPAVIQFQSDLARSHNNIGRQYAQQKQFDEAFASLEMGLAIRRKLTDADVKATPDVYDLGFSYAYRGWARVRAGQPAEAAVDLRRTIELWAKDPAPSVGTRFERSRALALLAGQGTDAKVGVTPADASTFADQSVADLRDGIKAGWAQVDELKEPDFDPIRDRADFQQLLAELLTMMKAETN